jgi:hypothetical protein
MSRLRALVVALSLALPAQAAVTDVSDVKEKLLVMDLKSSAGVSEDVAVTLTEVLVTALSDRGHEALSSSDLASLVDLEVQKEAAGCDDSSCLAEIGAALGARFVIYGRVSRLDDQVLLNLNLFDSAAAKPKGRTLLQAGSAGEIAQKIPGALPRLFGDDADKSPADADQEGPRGKRPEVSGRFIGSALATGLGMTGVTVGTLGAALSWSHLADKDNEVDGRLTARVLFYGSMGLVVAGLAASAWGIPVMVEELSE